VTLHLRASEGTYAGPIVVGKRKKGKRAIVGVRAGAKLGKVTVNSAEGFAKAKLPKKSVDRKPEARAKKGVPIGAGNFGRVRVKKVKDGAPGDLDRDGIADPLDIDDDGDLVLDNLDRKPRKGSKSDASAQVSESSQDFRAKSVLFGSDFAANANVSTDAQIESALTQFGILIIDILPGDSSELDCGQPQDNTDPDLGGLVYCTKGGTGAIYATNFGDEANWPLFPDCCDPDGDGAGTMQTRQGESGLMWLRHGATQDRIGSGDVLIQRVTTDGSESEFVTTLQYVFVTSPVLASYSDGQGNSAEFSYPLGLSGSGGKENPVPVKADPGGDVVLTLTFYRPQRRPIPPETGKWIDIGGLDHSASLWSEDLGTCPPTAYSTSDPNLTPIEGEHLGSSDNGGYSDLAGDQPASTDNAFTYRLNLSECLEKQGRSFNPGQTQGFSFAAYAPTGDNPDNADSAAFFRRVP
jgi:hypothetical protein